MLTFASSLNDATCLSPGDRRGGSAGEATIWEPTWHSRVPAAWDATCHSRAPVPATPLLMQLPAGASWEQNDNDAAA